MKKKKHFPNWYKRRKEWVCISYDYSLYFWRTVSSDDRIRAGEWDWIFRNEFYLVREAFSTQFWNISLILLVIITASYLSWTEISMKTWYSLIICICTKAALSIKCENAVFKFKIILVNSQEEFYKQNIFFYIFWNNRDSVGFISLTLSIINSTCHQLN